MRDLVQKALYLGVGLAAYAAEKAGSNLQELKIQSQKLAEELVARGEMNMEEAKRYVDELIQEAQSGAANKPPDENMPRSPRRIEIVEEEEGGITESSPSASTASPPQNADELRKQVAALQAELERLRRSS